MRRHKLNSYTISGSRFHRFNHVHLLLWQKRSLMERSWREYCHHWSGFLDIRPNSYNHFGLAPKSSHAKEQRVLPHHNESAYHAVFVELAVHYWRSIEQECNSLWSYCFDVALFVLDDERLVFRFYLRHLRPNHQRVVTIENEIYPVDGLRRSGDLCDGKNYFFLMVLD